MKLSRENWWGIALFFLLLLLTSLAAVSQQQQNAKPPPLSSLSYQANGTAAFRLWLDQTMTVEDETISRFTLSDKTALIFILEPSQAVTTFELNELNRWIDEGGTAVIVGQGFWVNELMSGYGVTRQFFTDGKTRVAHWQNPLWHRPVIDQPVSLNTGAYLSLIPEEEQDVAIHLAVEGKPVLLSFKQKDGRVVISTASDLFSNAGLTKAGHPAIAANIASSNQRVGTIWFDEWHHGLRGRSATISGPMDWLRFSYAGRAILFITISTLIWLVLRGRPFGRPIPLHTKKVRRAPIEYITALANIHRRANHQEAITTQYHQLLKRKLGQRYRLSAQLSDKEYVAALVSASPNIDGQALTHLLTRLNEPNLSEAELILLVQQISDWLKE